MKRSELLGSALALTALALVVVTFSGNAFVTMPGAQSTVSFEERRTRTLNELSESIDEAVADGMYGCCIEPACTMCYMGSWLWSDGVCRCDEMIANGEMNKVCPECKRGIEEGRCTGKPTVECSVE